MENNSNEIDNTEYVNSDYIENWINEVDQFLLNGGNVMSETKSIYELIPKIISEVEPVGKDHQNKQQNYKFRSIDDVYNVVNKLLGKHGISVFPKYQIIKDEVVKTDKGSYQKTVILQGIYKFTAPDGSFEETITFGEAIDFGDKAYNKAMSQAFKYALFQVFCIPTEEEKDTEHESPKISGTTDKNKSDDEKVKEEFENAGKEKIDDLKIKTIRKMLADTNTNEPQFCKYLEISDIQSMTNTVFIKAMKALEKKKEQMPKTQPTATLDI